MPGDPGRRVRKPRINGRPGLQTMPDLLEAFPINGYDPDNEPRGELAKHETDAWRSALVPTDEEIVDAALMADVMEKLSPGILKTDHQGRTNGCEGFSLAHVMQGAIFAATGVSVDLSGMFAYTESERAFPGGSVGIGRNQGAFLEGGRIVATKLGCCEERLFPFVGSYQWHKEGSSKRLEQLANAKQFIIPTAIPLKGWKDAWDWLKSGHGWVHIGIPFPSDWYGAQPYMLPRLRSRGVIGGHAIALSGWDFRQDKRIEMVNSWTGWGKQGKGLVHQDDIAGLLDGRGATIVGYSHRKLDANWRSYDLGWVMKKVFTSGGIFSGLGGSKGGSTV